MKAIKMPPNNDTKKRKKARLRRFPYPYKAALAILSDRHGITDVHEFRIFHKFLNTTSDTPYGPGLGLEIGDTFWFYDDIGKFSYFEKYSNKRSSNAGLIRDFVSSGFIDGLHTYGDFTNMKFERKYAEWALEEVEKTGMRISTWVNHGDRNNIQNVNIGVEYHQGAELSSPAYHLDLAKKMGIKFLWRDLTSVIGQDRRMKFRDYFSNGVPNGVNPLKYTFRSAAKATLSRIERISGESINFPWNLKNNSLLEPMRLGDNSAVYDFRRFNNHPENLWDGVRTKDLVRQLDPAVLKALIKSRGAAIIYNHLEYGRIDDPEVVTSLRRLSLLYQTGDIWVATATRLLHNSFVYRNLDWDETIEDNTNIIINIKSKINDPVFGEYKFTWTDLRGFTFYNSSGRGINLQLDGNNLEMAKSERRGRYVYTGIPLDKLEYPDL